MLSCPVSSCTRKKAFKDKNSLDNHIRTLARNGCVPHQNKLQEIDPAPQGCELQSQDKSSAKGESKGKGTDAHAHDDPPVQIPCGSPVEVRCSLPTAKEPVDIWHPAKYIRKSITWKEHGLVELQGLSLSVPFANIRPAAGDFIDELCVEQLSKVDGGRCRGAERVDGANQQGFDRAADGRNLVWHRCAPQ